MSSDRLRTQVNFENILSGNNPVVWQGLTKSTIKNFSFNATHVALMSTALKDDALDFYYKGLLSLYEGIISADKKNFSWATIKLYYSVYYFLRTTLCINNIAFVRKERDGYYFVNRVSENPVANGKPDHMAAIDLITTFFKGVDFLQSNTIYGIDVYTWMRHQRENINYKHRTFFEPDVPDIWSDISMSCDDEGIEYWIKEYIDKGIYCFIEDDAILALPIRRLIITHQSLISKGVTILVSPNKLIKLDSLVSEHAFLRPLRAYR